MRAERSEAPAQQSNERTRRKHSMQYKRQVVRESLKPGVSTREIARRHGLHESLVGVWRRRYAQEGLQETVGHAAEVKLLPVQVPIQIRIEPASSMRPSLRARRSQARFISSFPTGIA